MLPIPIFCRLIQFCFLLSNLRCFYKVNYESDLLEYDKFFLKVLGHEVECKYTVQGSTIKYQQTDLVSTKITAVFNLAMRCCEFLAEILLYRTHCH